MAGDLNHVVLIGRLTRDPEMRQLNSGATLCRFSVANNRIYTQNGEKREEVSFFNCVAWGRQAEVIHQYCRKGKQLALEGRLRQNSWQDNSGLKRSSVELVIEQFQFIGPSAQQDKGTGDWNPEAQFQQPEAEASSSSAVENKAETSYSNGSSGPSDKGEDDDIPF